MPVANVIPAAVASFAARLRFPQLFFLTAVIFLFDLVIPDLLPFVDEMLLALLTVLLGMWQQKSGGDDEPREVKDVTPRPPRASD